MPLGVEIDLTNASPQRLTRAFWFIYWSLASPPYGAAQKQGASRGAKTHKPHMAEPHPWQPDAASFVAQLLKHLDAGTLPSEVNPLPHVARGRGHGAARDASTLYAPHVLEECLAGAREERQRRERRRVRVTVVDTTPIGDHNLRFALLKKKGSDGDELLNDRVALLGRSHRNEAHCVVVPTREASSLHSTKSSGKTCRVAFRGNGVFVRGATLDVELRLDALPAFRVAGECR